MKVNKLFVYGTLAPGKPNEHVLSGYSGTWVVGSVKGKLYEQGWGAALGFPGLVLDEAAGEVVGQVFSSDELPSLWSMLDEFEGEGYQRVLTSVELVNGDIIEAYVYEINQGKD